MGPSGRVIGYADEECFADELIKMSHAHFAKQGARTTRVVKIAHVGGALARRRELEKQAISLGGVGKFLGGLAGKVSKGVSAAAKRVAPGPGATVARRATGVKPPTVRKTTPGVTPAARPAPMPKPATPTTGGVTARPIQQVGTPPSTKVPQPTQRPTPQPTQRPTPQQTPPAAQQAAPPPRPQPSVGAAAQGAAPVAPKKPGVLKRMFGGAGEVVKGGLEGSGALAEGATKGEKARNVAGRLIAGAAGHAPDTASAVGGSALLYGGSKAVGAIKNVLSRGGAGKLNRDVGRAIKRTSKGAVRDPGVISQMGLRNLGTEGAQAAANLGMSPRQLHALDDLADQGANLPKSTRRKLERAAGVSMDEIQEFGGVENVLRNRASAVAPAAVPASAAGAVPAAGAGRLAAGGGGKHGLLGGIGETALTIGIPVAGGLAASKAYEGMQGLAAQNRSTQYVHGAQNSPLNYSPTAAFPH